MIVAPPHGILTKKIIMPLTFIGGGVLVSSRGIGERGSGLFKLKCWSVLQNLVAYMWQLVLA